MLQNFQIRARGGLTSAPGASAIGTTVNCSFYGGDMISEVLNVRKSIQGMSNGAE